MRILFIGSGTIGITYSWLLSQGNEIFLLRRNCDYPKYNLHLRDLRKSKSGIVTDTEYRPQYYDHIDNSFDFIIVTVNAIKLVEVVDSIEMSKITNPTVVLTLNFWNIESVLCKRMLNISYLLAFPSSVGGGKDGSDVNCLLFDEATRIGKTGNSIADLDRLKRLFETAMINVVVEERMNAWMSVHSIQQSIGVGAFLQAGSFEAFRDDKEAISVLFAGYKEALEICERMGFQPNKFAPWNLFYLLPKFMMSNLI